MEKIPFKIEQNENGSFAIIENPQSPTYGSMAFCGDKVVRSPFGSREEALQRIKAIGEHFEYEPVEVNN